MSGAETWLDSVANVGRGVSGIIEVRAGGQGGYADVEAMATELHTPAITYTIGPGKITPGSWERLRFEVRGTVWITGDRLPDAYGEIVKYPIRLLDVYRDNAKGGLPAEIASCLMTGWSAPTISEWIPASRHYYMTLPFTLEVVVNTATGYTPA